MALEVQTEPKTPLEDRIYDFDWSDFTEFKDNPGTTITAVVSRTVTPPYDVLLNPNGIQLSSNIISGAHVQFYVSGGVSGVSYLIQVIIATSGGATLEGDGYLYVDSATVPN